MSTGKYICILNSDDIFNSNNTIENIVKKIEFEKDIEIFLFSLVFFKKNRHHEIIRHYKSTTFKKWMLNIGIIPPHPSSIIKRSTYIKNGLYNKSFKIAGDYELFLRLLSNKNIKYKTYDDIVVRMKTGGASGKNIFSYLTTLNENYKALKLNKLYGNYFTLILKIPSKFLQFFF